MKSALKRVGLLSRVIVALVVVAVVLLPFHPHDAAATEASPDLVKVAMALSDAGHDRSDTAPDSAPDALTGDCTACVLMKTIELPVTAKRSDALQITESIVYPVADVERPRRLIAEHFRPPCSARV